MNTKKKIIPASIAATVIALGSAVAAPAMAAGFSANIGAASNYLWRGVSQTGDAAAISGGLDYAHDSGLYAGTWLSDISTSGGTELDLYFGYAGEASGISYKAYYLLYAYPESKDDADADGDGDTTEDTSIDFGELNVEATYSFFTAGLGYTIHGGSDNEDLRYDSGDIYIFVAASVEVAEGWSLKGTYGSYDFDADGNVGVNDVNYGHFKFDITRSVEAAGSFTFSLAKADDETGDDDVKALVSWTKGL